MRLGISKGEKHAAATTPPPTRRMTQTARTTIDENSRSTLATHPFIGLRAARLSRRPRSRLSGSAASARMSAREQARTRAAFVVSTFVS